jgi:hypothetical protein
VQTDGYCSNKFGTLASRESKFLARGDIGWVFWIADEYVRVREAHIGTKELEQI